MVINSQRFMQTPRVFAGIITIGLIGVFADLLFRVGKRMLFPWVGDDNGE